MSERSRFFEGVGCVSEARPYGGYANEEDRPWTITDLIAVRSHPGPIEFW
ncbi:MULTISPECIES: hypothetical protein [unclassified Microcoleus]